jgi:RNA polymerase-interacting CarD/CdnL/TRCF family regulator
VPKVPQESVAMVMLAQKAHAEVLQAHAEVLQAHAEVLQAHAARLRSAPAAQLSRCQLQLVAPLVAQLPRGALQAARDVQQTVLYAHSIQLRAQGRLGETGRLAQLASADAG